MVGFLIQPMGTLLRLPLMIESVQVRGTEGEAAHSTSVRKIVKLCYLGDEFNLSMTKMFVNTRIFISQPQKHYVSMYTHVDDCVMQASQCVSSSMNSWNHNKKVDCISTVLFSWAKGSFHFTGCYIGIACRIEERG